MPIIYYLTESTNPKKKFDVYQFEGLNKIWKISFGQKGADDFTTHYAKEGKVKAEKYQIQYDTRHFKKEDWKKSGIKTAGYWARNILWNKKTIKDSIADIMKRDNITIIRKKPPLPVSREKSRDRKEPTPASLKDNAPKTTKTPRTRASRTPSTKKEKETESKKNYDIDHPSHMTSRLNQTREEDFKPYYDVVKKSSYDYPRDFYPTSKKFDHKDPPKMINFSDIKSNIVPQDFSPSTNIVPIN